MKKINDYLKRHMHLENLHLKGFKIGIGIWDAWVLCKDIFKIWVNED